MGKKQQILAVDDNSISLATIEQELEGEYEVIPINSGVRALQFLKKEQPDLILLDIQMAIKDGIETLKEIREMENCQDIPVIMLTSNANKQMVLKSSKLKISDYVLKPFKKRELSERVGAVLKRASEGQPAGNASKRAPSLLDMENQSKGKSLLDLENENKGKSLLDLENESKGKSLLDLENESKGKSLLDLENESKGKSLLDLENESKGKSLLDLENENK